MSARQRILGLAGEVVPARARERAMFVPSAAAAAAAGLRRRLFYLVCVVGKRIGLENRFARRDSRFGHKFPQTATPRRPNILSRDAVK